MARCAAVLVTDIQGEAGNPMGTRSWTVAGRRHVAGGLARTIRVDQTGAFLAMKMAAAKARGRLERTRGPLPAGVECRAVPGEEHLIRR